MFQTYPSFPNLNPRFVLHQNESNHIILNHGMAIVVCFLLEHSCVFFVRDDSIFKKIMEEMRTHMKLSEGDQSEVKSNDDLYNRELLERVVAHTLLL